MNTFLKLSDEVANALQQKKPVVALESTIIAHGMPYPKNVETALAVEQTIKNNGATPATIAIINGKCCVGLTAEEIEIFGKEKEVWKVSLRDMPYVISKKLFGATTVAATMRIAAMAGIKIFVTGGIGGVHRGAEKTMDISADLSEMAETNVAVVCAGVKSILDIGLTLEYLETKGIPVVTYGQKSFPSFYSTESNYNTPLQLNSSKEIAEMLQTKWALGLNGSVLIANPINKKDEVPFAVIESHITNALEHAEKQGIKGKETTPFLLQHIAQHTNGNSLEANISLIKNNAVLGAQIAAHL
ncbi:MAG TPA: pseudouridine-5'-phosphate glycosidase [Chitinophagaceae bacterium]|nr:pseudouridine-5'-phosphate glycosidase [Chitinophagaceae bacterium]HMZ45850.1 pseudouridine-5'-phosphate glycosidase [Chitinophagaceae bacterium]HNE93691.1 pseudouridine-5'-phosphate glycosidase [Chitinophagaceae bacterium]HNF28870.1 pseudouridine-5'-phosphate glycosidase [Chitinophagaceae bacterium]HNJ57504.1 pseudouridine-5'-phosphate glycosidase [Chitinophagaceae bacterium]